MGSTPIYSIPFADPTDLVRDWPDLSEDVAEAVEAAIAGVPILAGIGSNVVAAERTTSFSTSSTSFTNWTDVDVTITPSSDTSKVLVMLYCGRASTGGGSGFPVFMQIGRDTTEIGNEAQMRPDGGVKDAFSTLFVLDAPQTDAPVTYRGRVRVSVGSGVYDNGGIIAIEVAA